MAVHPELTRSPDPWPAPTADGPLGATVQLPGSKSLTARALILAALSADRSRITGGLLARDTTLMVAALRGLGADIDQQAGDAWEIRPGALTGAKIDCGLAGTVMRFVPPLAALATGTSFFDGDPHARTRPMSTLLHALSQAGVDVSATPDATLPFTVTGHGHVRGGAVTLDFSASSQFVSALLLAGARFDQGIALHHVGSTMPSLPHIAMTCAALRDAGVEVDDSVAERWLVAPGEITAPDVVIEPDLSNAAPFLGAALVCGGSVTVPRWPTATTQAGDALRPLLEQMGASVRLDADGLTVTGTGAITALTADLHEVGELTPVLAALCALAEGRSVLTGVGHIRGHETDRLAAICAELSALGTRVEQTDDGLIIDPAPLRPGVWHAYADHRMAQAGALVGLAVPGCSIDDIGSTTKTMTDFAGLWTAMVHGTAHRS